jgi:hypothetical protein
MNREWVTLAFGIALVSGVVVVSVWQNYPSQHPEPKPAPGDTPPPKAEAGRPPAAEATPSRAQASPAASSAAPSRAQVSPVASPVAPSAAPATPSATARIDATVPVVHKHRFGDCQGTLRAMPGTLTYSTADKDDAFRMPFAEIEEFELDADRKNLRIRRRGGRTWNFSPRGDSLTALAAFHKEAVRAKR